ncbi:MAG: mechanosensitive ion channel family protein [Methanomassiliicoccaceae archaeon]|nr:mechanosensitive ion channel family protein [Methanomassiliicoccaceae archaeon]
MMHAKRTLLFAAIAILLLAAVPLFSDNAEGADPSVDVKFTFAVGLNDDGHMGLIAGKEKKVNVIVQNDSGGARYVRFDDVVGIDHSEPSKSLIFLDPGRSDVISVTISADKYIGTVGNRDVRFVFEVYDPAVPEDKGYRELHLTVDITSMRGAENQFNKIMGIWDPFLPEPFDTALYTTVLTLLIWLAIAVLIAYGLFPAVLQIFFRTAKEKRHLAKKKIQRPILSLIMLYAATVCVHVIGAGEYIISAVEAVVYILFILLGAQIAWRLYVAATDVMIVRAARRGRPPHSSILPLLRMIGKIVIGMVTAGAVLAAIGFDLMIIVAGAGVIGLAISFGAQSTLAQFFSGFTLLITRPFKPGDLVRLNSDPDVLKVVGVGFMTTTFKNWSNSEVFTMPNQKVAASTIVNITAETSHFRVTVLVRVPYGTDIALAKRLALEAMTEHPRIMQDGSEEMPKSRVHDLGDSYLVVRVSGFVDDFEDNGSITAEIREAIYRKYNEFGVEIAVPKMEVELDRDDWDKKY